MQYCDTFVLTSWFWQYCEWYTLFFVCVTGMLKYNWYFLKLMFYIAKKPTKLPYLLAALLILKYLSVDSFRYFYICHCGRQKYGPSLQKLHMLIHRPNLLGPCEYDEIILNCSFRPNVITWALKSEEKGLRRSKRDLRNGKDLAHCNCLEEEEIPMS